MPLYIKDDVTADLVAKLATARGISKQAAVKMAVTAELDRTEPRLTLSQKIAAWRTANPMPPPTGLKADKAFFDELWGEP